MTGCQISLAALLLGLFFVAAQQVEAFSAAIDGASVQGGEVEPGEARSGSPFPDARIDGRPALRKQKAATKGSTKQPDIQFSGRSKSSPSSASGSFSPSSGGPDEFEPDDGGGSAGFSGSKGRRPGHGRGSLPVLESP